MNKCICKDWEEQIKLIDNFILFCENQTAGPKWDNDKNIMFRYCPWCGGKLTKENHTTEEIKELINPFGLGPK